MRYTILQVTKQFREDPQNFETRFTGDVDPVFFLKAYKEVCAIEAKDLNEVFEIGNIGPEEKIERLDRMHSISVGDVIRDDCGRCFVVSPVGFKRLGEEVA
jgi:hypothetical protein